MDNNSILVSIICLAYSESKEIAVVLYGEGLEKERMMKTEMEEQTIIEFEGRRFPSLKHPEEYLKRMYGNYMELPPESQRVSKHNSKIIRIE